MSSDANAANGRHSEYEDAPALRRQEWSRSEELRAGDRSVSRLSRSEVAAQLLIDIAQRTQPGERMGSMAALRERCQVSVGTFNEAIRLAQSRGVITSRPGPGGGVFAAEQSPMVRLGNSVLALTSDQTSVAEAARIRDALDPLLIEDALWHCSPSDIADMRRIVSRMAGAASNQDATEFALTNWELHARIAAVSPNPVLRSLYLSLLDLIKSHTLSVLPVEDQALGKYIADRHRLHEALVEALAAHDQPRALSLTAEHSVSDSHH